MQMGSCRAAGISSEGDRIAYFYDVALFYEEAGKMSVNGFETI